MENDVPVFVLQNNCNLGLDFGLADLCKNAHSLRKQELGEWTFWKIRINPQLHRSQGKENQINHAGPSTSNYNPADSPYSCPCGTRILHILLVASRPRFRRILRCDCCPLDAPSAQFLEIYSECASTGLSWSHSIPNGWKYVVLDIQREYSRIYPSLVQGVWTRRGTGLLRGKKSCASQRSCLLQNGHEIDGPRRSGRPR